MLCRRCGATIHDGLRVCPHCGERQVRQPSHVSCAHCRHKAPAASSICPRCGQTLHARRLSGGVLASVGLILVVSLALSAGLTARGWSAVQDSAQERLTRIEADISELGGKVLDTASSLAKAEPDSATATPSPVVVLAVLPDTNRAVAAPLQSEVVLAPTTVGGAVGGPGLEPTAVAALAEEASPTSEPTATEQPTAEPPTATAEPTATEAPTAAPLTATPTATEAPPTRTPTLPPPTRTPTLPTPTPTSAPATATPQAVAAAAATGGGGLTHTVQAGDNWFSIARRYGVTQEALAAYNGSQPSDVLQVNQLLRVPSAGAGAAAAGSATQTYAVQAGDNWFSIARRYGITQETLAAYNNSRPSDVLQVGQVLRIPAAGVVVSPPTSTPEPARPTAVPAAATPTAPAAAPTRQIPPMAALAAPALLSPPDGDGFAAATQPVLSWRPAAGIGPQDYYYVLIRFTQRDGQPLNVAERVTSTSFVVPVWVYDVTSPPDHLGVWSVQVRRMGPGNQEIELSPPSELRTFYWR